MTLLPSATKRRGNSRHGLSAMRKAAEQQELALAGAEAFASRGSVLPGHPVKGIRGIIGDPAKELPLTLPTLMQDIASRPSPRP